MIKYYKEGYDQVIAKRNRKGDNKYRTWATKLYYKLVNKLIDVELVDGVGDFRLLSRKAVDSILAMKKYNRFSKGIFSWIGFKQKTIQYENQSRVAGENKWSFKSLLSYGIDAIVVKYPGTSIPDTKICTSKNTMYIKLIIIKEQPITKHNLKGLSLNDIIPSIP